MKPARMARGARIDPASARSRCDTATSMSAARSRMVVMPVASCLGATPDWLAS
jgi:hypothetical protein